MLFAFHVLNWFSKTFVPLKIWNIFLERFYTYSSFFYNFLINFILWLFFHVCSKIVTYKFCTLWRLFQFFLIFKGTIWFSKCHLLNTEFFSPLEDFRVFQSPLVFQNFRTSILSIYIIFIFGTNTVVQDV